MSGPDRTDPSGLPALDFEKWLDNLDQPVPASVVRDLSAENDRLRAEVRSLREQLDYRNKQIVRDY